MGPTALITGASSGIGLELARVFASKHYSLVLVARDRARLEELANELHRTFLVRTRIEVCDLSDRAALDELLRRLEQASLVVDVLVNNAGVGIEGPFASTSGAREREMMDVNMDALVQITKAFLKPMVKRGSGRILQVASTAAYQPGPYFSVYFATKAFVLAFSEAISIELRGTGVTVTTLCPGPTRTRFAERLGANSKFFETGLPVATASKVASYGYSSLMRGKRVAIPGVLNRLLVGISGVLPRSLLLPLMAWVIGRKSVSRSVEAEDFPVP